MIFQSVEMGRPQPAIGLEPVIELGQRLWPDAVEPTLRVGTYRRCLDTAGWLRPSRSTNSPTGSSPSRRTLRIACRFGSPRT
jgi:hypothetical protein